MKTVAGQSAAPEQATATHFHPVFFFPHTFLTAGGGRYFGPVSHSEAGYTTKAGEAARSKSAAGCWGGVPGWCSGSVPRVACCRLCLCGLLGLVGRNWLQRVLAPRGCGGLTIVLWMLAQLPIGRCAGQSDCEPGPVSVGTRLLHGSTFPRLPWPRPRGDPDCREPVLGKCVLSLGALPSRPVSLLGVLGAEAGRSW
jgi:hypothetical protein